MRASRRTLAALIFVVPFLLLVGLGVIMVRRYYRGAERDLAPILATEATRLLGHEVRIGKVTLKSGFAYVDDVRIAEGRRMSDRGPVATARQVIADFDLREILLTRTLPTPLFGNVKVLDPVARAVRGPDGAWTFMDLFKPKPGVRQRSPVGRVTIVNGVINYSDSALPHNPNRKAGPVAATVNRISATITFNADTSVGWEAAGLGSPATAESLQVSGSWEPAPKRLFLRINAGGFSLPLAARLLPPDVTISAGKASGRITLIRNPETVARRAGWPFDVESGITISGAAVSVSRVREPASNVSGQFTISNDIATFRADSGFAGSLVHAEGTVSDFSRPHVDGWATGGGVDLRRVIVAFDLDRRYPALRPFRDVRATADIRADVSGPVNNPSFRASGPAVVVGQLPAVAGSALLPQSGRVQVAFDGPLSAPRVSASGMLPRILFRGMEASSLYFSGVYTPRRAAVSFRGSVAGGSVTGSADIDPGGPAPSYRLEARARRVDLAKLPLLPERKGVSALKPAPTHVDGLADLDIDAEGRFDKSVPRGVAEIRADKPMYGRWEADRITARVISTGDKVLLNPAVIMDDKGDAIVRGSIDPRTGALDLSAEAERLDVARIAAVDEEKPVPGKSKAAAPPEGILYVRSARITGTLKRPEYSGRVYGYGLQADGFGVDFATAEVTGTIDSMEVRSAVAYRFPASATASGLIRRPFSPRAELALTGSLRDAEVHDLLESAGSHADVSGIAGADFRIIGLASSPEVIAPAVSITGARIGNYDFRSVTGSLRFDPEPPGGAWRLDNFEATRDRTNPQLTDLTTIRGSASLDGGNRFTIRAQATNVDLDLLAPYMSDYAVPAGVAEISAEQITGVIQDGEAQGLAGLITAKTTGLTINGVSIGDLRGVTPGQPAVLTLNGDEVTSDDMAIGDGGAAILLARRGVVQHPLLLNRVRETVQITGDVQGIDIEKLRQILAKSPYLAAHPDNPAVSYLGPTIAPLEGTLGGSFSVTGAMKSPVADLTWFSKDARIEGQQIQTFEGRIQFDRDMITLSGPNGRVDATLRADEAVATAHGFVRLTEGQESLSGDADIHGLPLSVLDRWFPARRILKDLSGTVDTIQVQAAGTPSNPSLVISGLLTDVVWIETQELPLQAPRSATAPAGAGTAAATAAAPKQSVDSGASKRTFVTRHDRSGKPIQLQTTGREFRIRRIDASTIRINDPANPGHLRADDVHVTLEDQAPTPTAGAPATKPAAAAKPLVAAGPKPSTAPQPPASSYVIYGSGEAAFDWQHLDALATQGFTARVRVPKQGLGLLAALTPTAPRAFDDEPALPDLVGTIEADLTWEGTRERPAIVGTLNLDADHLRVGGMTTQLKNLRADLLFTGDTLRVQNFSALTQVINPRTGAPIRTSDAATPLAISGEIPLRDNVAATPTVSVWPLRISGPVLRITGANLRVAEAPMPGLKTGRLVADNISTDLTIGGTLFRPIIRGTVGISEADVRMPDSFEFAPRAGVAIAEPVLDLGFSAGNNVRISSALLSATVHTDPGGPVLLRGDTASREPLNLAGNLIIDKGTLALPTARFTVQRGGVVSLRYPTFALRQVNPNASNDPALAIVVNLSATTKLTATSVSGTRRRYTITVEARGPINASAPLSIGDSGTVGANLLGDRSLQLTFKTDPNDLALTSAAMQQRIVGLLGGQDAIESLFSRSPDVGRLLRTQLTESLSNSFLPELFEKLGLGQALGLEEFSVDISQLNAFTLVATRQLIGPLYATYTRRLSGTAGPAAAGGITDYGWEFKLSYRFPVSLLRTNLQFSYSVDDQRTNAYLLEGVFKF